MKQIYKYILIFILGVITCLLFRSCGNRFQNGNTSTKEVRAKEAKIKVQKQEAKVIHDTVLKWRTKYREVRRDSLITCETKLVICDTVVKWDSVLISKQGGIILAQDSVISDWHTIHSQDSTSLVKANKEVKRQKRKVIFWKVVAGVSAGLNLVPR